MTLPTLLVSRRQRQAGTDWFGAASWFGGGPKMGDTPWPRDAAQNGPMYFLAQIDLADVARQTGPSDLPADGALAFFLNDLNDGNRDCAVVQIPGNVAGQPTVLPADARPVLQPSGDIFPQTVYAGGQLQFPFWPIDLTGLEIEDGADEKAQRAVVETHVATREYFLSARQAREALGDQPMPHWWHSAHYYARSLQTALGAFPDRYQEYRRVLENMLKHRDSLEPKGLLGGFGRRSANSKKIEEFDRRINRTRATLSGFEQHRPDFERFVQTTADWALTTEPFQQMSAEDYARLEEIFHRGKKEFGDFTRYRTPLSMDDLETETLLALATADNDAYATLPEPVRRLINETCLLPSSMWHQMFGRGVDIQGSAVWENEKNILLLQLVYDDMMSWRFGDMGAYQFWISPQDLAARNWSGTRVTFECS